MLVAKSRTESRLARSSRPKRTLACGICRRIRSTASCPFASLRAVRTTSLPARASQAIAEVVKLASPALQEVINDLQALRGIADISAVTTAAELGQASRFDSARQLMGYCGAVPSEDSSGKRTRRGSITKTGNAHLRRIVVEAAWS